MTGAGMISAAGATFALVIRLALHSPGALIAFGALLLLAFLGRPWIVARVETE